MRTLLRNKRKIYFCIWNGNVPVVDENGNRTGEFVPVYRDAVALNVNVSPATGASATEQFGNLERYDKVLVTTDMNCPITESTVLFVDKDPVYTEADCYYIIPPSFPSDDEHVEPVSYTVPAYDYIVVRVSKSINSISIAIRKAPVM